MKKLLLVLIFFVIFLSLGTKKTHALRNVDPTDYPPHSIAIRFCSTNPTNWQVIARYYNINGQLETSRTFDTNNLAPGCPDSRGFVWYITDARPEAGDYVIWSQACVDPRLDIVTTRSEYVGDGAGGHYYLYETVEDVRCHSIGYDGTPGRIYAGCYNLSYTSTNYSSWGPYSGTVTYSGQCPYYRTNRSYCTAGGRTAYNDSCGPSYCGGTGNCTYYNKTCSGTSCSHPGTAYSDNCGGSSISGTSMCTSETSKTCSPPAPSVSATGRCVGASTVNIDVNYTANSGSAGNRSYDLRWKPSSSSTWNNVCSPPTSGSGTDYTITSSSLRQNTTYQVQVREHTDAGYNGPTNFGTGTVTTPTCCTSDADCSVDKWCNSTGNCVAHESMEGRVFIDSNEDNNYDTGIDTPVPNASVWRRNATTTTWPTTEDGIRWIRTGGTGWFTFSSMRNSPLQDVAILRSEFGLPNAANCTYEDTIRSGYRGVVQTSPGYRRDDVEPQTGNPDNLNFMLRYKEYNVSGTVWIDANHNRIIDPVSATNPTGDTRMTNTGVRVRTQYSGVTVDSDNINSSGNYSIDGLNNSSGDQTGHHRNGATYAVQLLTSTLPTSPVRYYLVGGQNAARGFVIGNGLTTAISCANSTGNSFLVTDIPSVTQNTISGYVFNDINGDGDQDAGESNYTGADTSIVISTLPAIPVPATGTFTSPLISSALTYTVSLINIPAGWEATRPTAVPGFPPRVNDITLGTTNCDIGDSTTATCVAGNITNLAFGIRPSPPDQWTQGTGGDMRSDDDNALANVIPALTTPVNLNPFFSIASATLLQPGIAFGRGLDLGNGGALNPIRANQPGQYVEEDYSGNVIRTSYAFIEDNLRKNNTLSGAENIIATSITMPELTGNNIYTSGDLAFNGDFDFSGGTYIFLVDGDVDINSNINVTRGATLFIISNGNINVAENVTNIQGIFSADGSFVVSGNDADPTLNQTLVIEGSVIGITSYVNNRNLDFRNAITPSVNIIYRPDFVLSAPAFLRYTNYTIKEVAPGSD